MIAEAVHAAEAVIWGAIVAFAFLAAFTAYLAIALGYWAGVFAIWASRTITHHLATRKEKP
ncbi:hypothetical protein ACIPIC_02805 [Streptomyces collinus]|uniref:hypothetical protein n=1 Tax=Streptomyces collinus TaxID=42684 RepID=UPI003806B634